MEERVFVRGVEFTQIDAELRRILQAIDAGTYDKELAAAGIARDPAAPLSSGFTLSVGQGVGPETWGEFIGVFTPLAAVMARDVWKQIVLPKLKKAFREDSVSDHNPAKSKKS